VWFAFVAAGLALLVASGLYARRRIATALAELGVGPRWVRAVRWLIAWLLFGFPVVMIVAIVASLLLGRSTLPRFDGLVAGWLLAIPFALASLVIAQATLWLLALDLAALFVRRPRIRAYATIAIVGAFAIYTPARILAERRELRVRTHRVGAGPATLRIAFLSDVHQDVHTDGDRAREVYALVNAGAPDLVLAGGDWINTGPDYITAAAEAAGTLHGRLGVFSVRGDHEHFAYRDRERSVAEIERAMHEHGVQLLNNDVRWFEHAGKRVAVVFLGYTYIQRADRATIERLLASVAGAAYTIVVTQILYSGGTFTGSSSGLSGFESFQIELNTWFWISGVFLVVVTAGTWLFVQSDAGRVLVAIRENEPRCEYLGLNVSRVKTLLLAASAVIASIAGYAFASVQMVVAPEYAGFVFGTELTKSKPLSSNQPSTSPIDCFVSCGWRYWSSWKRSSIVRRHLTKLSAPAGRPGA